MRPKIFKGKDMDTGEWVQGANIFIARGDEEKSSRCLIVPSGSAVTSTFVGDGSALTIKHSVPAKEVIPETVCQYIGKRDVNGKKIFEGDVFRILYYKTSNEADTEDWENKMGSIEDLVYVDFDPYTLQYIFRSRKRLYISWPPVFRFKGWSKSQGTCIMSGLDVTVRQEVAGRVEWWKFKLCSGVVGNIHDLGGEINE